MGNKKIEKTIIETEEDLLPKPDVVVIPDDALKKKGSKKGLFLIIVLLLVLIGVGIGVFLFININKNNNIKTVVCTSRTNYYDIKEVIKVDELKKKVTSIRYKYSLYNLDNDNDYTKEEATVIFGLSMMPIKFEEVKDDPSVKYKYNETEDRIDIDFRKKKKKVKDKDSIEEFFEDLDNLNAKSISSNIEKESNLKCYVK